MADLRHLVEKSWKIVAKVLEHKGTRGTLVSTTKELGVVVEQIEQRMKEMDLPAEKTDKLKGTMAVAQEVVRKYSRTPWWYSDLTPYHRSKLDAADSKVLRYIAAEMKTQTVTDLEEILPQSSSDGGHTRALSLKEDVEILPDFTRVLDGPGPLNGLKFSLNLSNLAGSGKTALSGGPGPLKNSDMDCDDFVGVPGGGGGRGWGGDISIQDPPLHDDLDLDLDLDHDIPQPRKSSESLKKYDVFISFRGEDIRSSFKGYLHDALCRNNIETYVDDRLDIGDELWPALAQAIEDSVLFLVIFSENYASSSWCLKELAKILECTQNKRNHVMPVFYKIDPSQVRRQTGSFQMALAKHEHNHSKEQVDNWRTALTQAANLSGWHSFVYSDEVELIQQIVTHIEEKLEAMFPLVYSDRHFGIYDQIAHVESLLRHESQDVRYIGIWGGEGIGKTTIASELYKKLSSEFEGCYFLGNVEKVSEKHEMSLLKNRVLSSLLGNETSPMGRSRATRTRLLRKKVLLVLDDINDPLQIINLAGELAWLGKGSRVIITARNKQVFGRNVDETYKVQPLGSDHALRLFKFYAFKDDCSNKEFEQLSLKVVEYAKGTPLTLLVLGSFLFGKNLEQWEKLLDKITKIPVTQIQPILKLSYGEYNEEKDIILDTASTVKYREAEHIKKLLDELGYSRIEGLGKVLQITAEGQK